MTGEKFLYLLAGTGIGAAIGLLFAPKAGSDLRSSISGSVTDALGNVRETGIRETASSTLHKVAEQGKNIARMGRQRVNESIEAGKQRYEESIESRPSPYEPPRDVVG